MDLGNQIALGLTAIGTGITCWQAYKVKSYRDEIQTDRHRLALIELLPIAKSAREECNKITTPVLKPMRGVNEAAVISKIQSLSEKMSEYGHRINRETYRSIAVTELDKLIGEYKAKKEPGERFAIADRMYTEINRVIRILSSKFDASI